MSPTEHAWTQAELDAPHDAADKARKVRAMFAAIARTYDLNNRLHSFGRDQSWRHRAVRLAEVKSTDIVLDVACGTGDLSLAFQRAGAALVIGVDFTFPMLTLAGEKAGNAPSNNLGFAAGDAMRLPVGDASVDVVSIAFGIRNVAQPPTALREFARVLKPGGRLIVLEFTQPTNRFIRTMSGFYCDHIMPRTATWIARDKTGAYKYLPRSVSTFADAGAFTAMLRAAGFTNVTAQPVTLGIATIYRGIMAA